METLKCRKCNKQVEYNEEPSGKHIKATCKECGSYIKFISQPIGKIDWEIEVIPLPKHLGKTFKQVAKEDPKYIRWLALETRGRLAKIADLAIEEFMI